MGGLHGELPTPTAHIDTQEHTQTHTHTHTALPWAPSLQDRVCNMTPLYRQETEAQEAGEPCSEGWRWGGVGSCPGSRGRVIGEQPGHPGAPLRVGVRVFSSQSLQD